MANIKSQQKRILTNERRRLRNQSVKSSLRTAVRGLRAAIDAGEKEKAAELLVTKIGRASCRERVCHNV